MDQTQVINLQNLLPLYRLCSLIFLDCKKINIERVNQCNTIKPIKILSYIDIMSTNTSFFYTSQSGDMIHSS